MIKIRLSGEIEEIQEEAKRIMKDKKVLKKSKPHKNTRDKDYRLYIELEA